ncbi:MAG: N-acetylmuramoyl-L-alanine amidase [Bacteroidota bacterium]
MTHLRLIVLLLLTLSIQAFGQNQRHATAIAQPGSGIYSLLNTHRVKTNCNLSYFYKINDMRKKQGLREGRAYQLPILVYTYNGKSIRSTVGKNDLDWAKKVEAYNDAMFSLGLKQGDYRKDKVLWVPYHMIYCANESVEIGGTDTDSPSLSRSNNTGRVRGNYKIFGEDYATVPLMSTEMNGKVFYLVSGHGGPDPGAVGNYGKHSLCEDEYAYDVTLRLAWTLLSHGATVYIITRDENDGIRNGEILKADKEETCWLNQEIPISQSERLTQRSDAVNALYRKNKKQGVDFQRLVVIHIDSNSKGKKTDVFFYHKIDDSKSKSLALTMRQTMQDKYDYYRKNRGYDGTVSSRDLHMLRETDPTAVFIELGNIRNRSDQARLILEGNRQLMANWLFEGLLKDAKSNRR